ncbi:MAG: prepilin-type N-terminal cleavage/methylation domain-containing protein [Pirellulales bacterium]|nr:prepilin-type N-terminal cleavage/methylation domain-containing protein [Pirellulales bacterium]
MPLRSRCARSGGFTLLELLMVIAVVAIVTAALVPWAESTAHDTMVAAAQTVATDMAYARSLAIANNSSYKVHFDSGQNRYILEHSGTNEALDTLPRSVFSNPGDPPNQHIVELAALPGVGESVRLAGVFRAGATPAPINEIEFGSLGETTETDHSVVLLTIGSGSGRRHALILVNPITGLATVHPYSQNLPSDLSPETAGAIANTLDEPE